MWKKIGAGVAVVIVVFLIVVATRPDTYHVERSINISATPEAVYAHVADFHKWEGWSPWDKIDPNMKRTFEGTQGAVGAKYGWVGNDQVGEGTMTVLTAEPAKRFEVDLHFIKPFESSAKNGFTFAATGKETKVTWLMDGKFGFMEKAVCMFMDMDGNIGKDFEKGLADLKKVSESAPAPAAQN